MFEYARFENPEFQIQQRYDEEFVRELAPLIPSTEWIQPQRIIMRDEHTNQMYLGKYWERRSESQLGKFCITSVTGVRMWSVDIQGERVVLYQTHDRNEMNDIQWAVNPHVVYCAVADFLEYPIRVEGWVYVPKEIPTDWYTVDGEQVSNTAGTAGIDPHLEEGSGGSANDSDGVLTERLKFRVTSDDDE